MKIDGGLPVRLAHDLADLPEERRWLITDLWAAQAVGIVGGEPKCCKSFLALDMAVAVAAGTPCLRRFSVADPGPVLLYAAEDAAHIVRRRLEGICAAAGVALDRLPVHVITARAVRLDHQDDKVRLTKTVEALRPKLLILDPFVRLHRIDENSSGEVAPLLAYLRDLQRCLSLAVCVVHHARKGAGRVRAGQALRGSSEFHAWGDSNLYMRRSADHQLVLSVEQRAASCIGALSLDLVEQGSSLALQVRDQTPAAPSQPLVQDGPAARI
ncbi:MAG: AAA family ATPase, partial [Chloroflexota bacterium]